MLVEERRPLSARAQGQVHGAPSSRLEEPKWKRRADGDMLMIVLVVLVVVRYLHNITRVWDTRAMPRIKCLPRLSDRVHVIPRMCFTSSIRVRRKDGSRYSRRKRESERHCTLCQWFVRTVSTAFRGKGGIGREQGQRKRERDEFGMRFAQRVHTRPAQRRGPRGPAVSSTTLVPSSPP